MRRRERTSYLVETVRRNRKIGSDVVYEPQIPMIAGDEGF
jgi:hypothetical protein